jgi:hypothetical protein
MKKLYRSGCWSVVAKQKVPIIIHYYRMALKQPSMDQHQQYLVLTRYCLLMNANEYLH